MLIENLNKYEKTAIILLLIYITISLLQRLPVINAQIIYFFNRTVFPLFWAIFIWIFFFKIPKIHPTIKVYQKESIYFEAAICGVVIIVSKVLLGSILGQLGASPYDLSLNGIFTNLFFVLPALTSREIIRSYALNVFCKKYNSKTFILIVLLTSLLSLNLTNFMIDSDLESVAIFISKEAGPVLAMSFMLSYLGLYGGALAPIICVWVQELFYWASPILSEFNWLGEGAIGIIIPAFCIVLIEGKYGLKKKGFRDYESQKKKALGWMVTGLFSVGLLWFVFGVFPFMPSVIATGSMEPLIDPGDMIIINRIQTEEQIKGLKVGDIVQFARGEILITHRIIEVLDDGIGNLTFRTKGDNNSDSDSQPVHPNDIKGILIKVIPKVGCPALLVKQKGDIYREYKDQIEF